MNNIPVDWHNFCSKRCQSSKAKKFVIIKSWVTISKQEEIKWWKVNLKGQKIYSNVEETKQNLLLSTTS